MSGSPPHATTGPHEALGRVIDRYEAARAMHARSRGDERIGIEVELDRIARELWVLLRGMGRAGFPPDPDLGGAEHARESSRGRWRYVAGAEPGELWRLRRSVEEKRGRKALITNRERRDDLD